MSYTIKEFNQQFKAANKGGIVSDISKFYIEGNTIIDIDEYRTSAIRKQKRNFMGASAFFMGGGVKMTDIIEAKGARGAVRVMETQGIKASEFDIETFIPIAREAIRNAGDRQVTTWHDAGVDVYDNKVIAEYIRRGVETIITTAARSERGNNITVTEINRDMSRDFFAGYISSYARAQFSTESKRKAFDKAVKATKDVIAYSLFKLEEMGEQAHVSDNGFQAYYSAIGNQSIISFTEVIYHQFVQYSDILVINEIATDSRLYSDITINPDVMDSITTKVTESKMSRVTGGYFIDEAIPEVSLNMIMGHASDIIGKEVTVYGSTHHKDLGDTSVVVEAINNNNKSGLVIDQFMASNFSKIEKALAAAKARQ